VKNLPNGKSPGINGIPHELWKKMATCYENDKKAGNTSFNVVKVLTKVYNDIELHGVDPTTEFSVGWLCPLYKKGEQPLLLHLYINTQVFPNSLHKSTPGIPHHPKKRTSPWCRGWLRLVIGSFR
jgi:hypothetical protein